MNSKSSFDPVAKANKLSAALNQDLSDPRYTEVGEARYSEVLREYQYENTTKKVEADGDLEMLENKAFEAFLSCNRDMGHINQCLFINKSLEDRSIPGYILRRARQVIGWVLGDITTDEVFYASRHSNGVTQGIPYMDTSLNRKSSFPWTCTQSASKILKLYDQYDPSYRDACFQASSGLKSLVRFKIINGSRATTVPKTLDKRRMIAVEPTGNMFIQQGLMEVMYDRLRRVGLDVKTLPDRHKDLAYWSSVSGHLSTIDLSSASDSISTQLISLLFPKKWLWWLWHSRSPKMLINKQWTNLNVYATMGNATTFPVETLVFWAIAVSCCMFYRNKKYYGVAPWRITSTLTLPRDRRDVSVFGDDIILPTEVVPDLFYMLGSIGFSINSEKSYFGKGLSFRESCGGDFFHGRRMRPFFIKGPATRSWIGREAWFYVMANTLLKKYRSYFGGVGYIYEKQAFRLVFDWLRQCTPLIKVVPASFPDDSGLQGLEGLRLARAYLPDDLISPIGVSEQGWHSFKYLRFRYKRERKIHEALKYSQWLKNQTVRQKTSYSWFESSYFEYPKVSRWSDYLRLEEEHRTRSPLRKKGDYVVARSSSQTF